MNEQEFWDECAMRAMEKAFDEGATAVKTVNAHRIARHAVDIADGIVAERRKRIEARESDVPKEDSQLLMHSIRCLRSGRPLPDEFAKVLDAFADSLEASQ